MMFFQYAIWGAWLPILFPFLQDYRKFSGEQIGTMFAVGAVGALLAPFVAGQIADRFFATQKFLGISHIIGAALVWNLADVETYSGFLWFSLAYSLVYAPTLPLSNSLALHHLKDRDTDFAKVRVWGTVGWIVVGIAVGQWLLLKHSPSGLSAEALKLAQNAGRADAFRLSAIIGLVMGVYCFFLPNTPPRKGKEAFATWEALKEILGNATLRHLFVVSLVVSCIHQFYFVHTAGFLSEFQAGIATSLNKVFGVGGGGLMTIGQMTEIAVLAIVPLFAKKYSRKTFLIVGLLAYALRMLLFSYVHVLPMPEIATLVLGVALHGLCFGCFIFVAFMIVDEETTADVRASAQSLYNLVVIGIGIIVGSYVATTLVQGWAADGEKFSYASESITQRLFSVPMWASLACLAYVIAFYPRHSSKADVD